MSLLPPVHDALALNDAIEREASSLKVGEVNLNRGYARLAGMLVMFKLNEGWRETKHSSFNSYILGLSEKYGRSPQQLYAYVSAAEKLLPVIGEAGLDRMGISKAQELIRAAKHAKMSIPQGLIEAALDDRNGVAEMRALAHQTFELKGEAPKGKYLDIGGFYADDEQHKTFVEAVKISMRKLNLPTEMPDWKKRQLIILFWAQEICGTYAAEVYAPPQVADNG